MVRRLDLQELYGQPRDIIVKGPQGGEYGLRRPNEMGPKELVRFNRLESTFAAVAQGLEGGLEDYREQWEQASESERENMIPPEEHEDEWAERLETLMTQIIGMLNEDLGDMDLPFPTKVKILEFYKGSLDEEAAAATEVDPTPSDAS